MSRVSVIGGGPAGLAAAEVIAAAGHSVTIFDAKPSLGRKFLMAGKSGLNLTNASAMPDLMAEYAEAAPWLAPAVVGFDNQAIVEWATGLGQDMFVGTTARVFPRAMKASPLLRAWLARLDGLDVTRHMRWRWTGWDDTALTFDTPDGTQTEHSDVTVLALGGASWARLGSDGAWAGTLTGAGITLAPLASKPGRGVGVQTRFIVTNIPGGRAKHFYEKLYCARGRMENMIKEHKTYLASDRTSCHRWEANQFRLLLAYWMMLDLRNAAPRRSRWRTATFETIRTTFLKVAARIETLVL